MPNATTKKPRKNEYFDPKDVPTGTQNTDGTWTYTFTADQKELLFSALSMFGNIVGTTDDRLGLTKKKIRGIRALREGF